MKTGNRKPFGPIRLLQSVDMAIFNPWDELSRLPGEPDACPLRQAWLAHTEQGFQPGWITWRYTGDALLVIARLEGPDIGNPVTGRNQLAFQAGDVFEVFLQAEESEGYLEVHVTPNNDRLELWFPSAAARLERVHLTDVKKQLDPFLVAESGIHSEVRVRREPDRWEVLVQVPFSLFVDLSPVPQSWRFSCCRYDYRRDRPNPILSSTSPHSVCDFHRREEWGELRLAEGLGWP